MVDGSHIFVAPLFSCELDLQLVKNFRFVPIGFTRDIYGVDLVIFDDFLWFWGHRACGSDRIVYKTFFRYFLALMSMVLCCLGVFLWFLDPFLVQNDPMSTKTCPASKNIPWYKTGHFCIPLLWRGHGLVIAVLFWTQNRSKTRTSTPKHRKNRYTSHKKYSEHIVYPMGPDPRQ